MQVEQLRKSALGWEMLELLQRIETLESRVSELSEKCDTLEETKADRRGRKPKGL